MRKNNVYIYTGILFIFCSLMFGGQSVAAQTSNSSAYISSLIEILRAQIEQSRSAISNITNVPAWTIPTAPIGGGTTCVPTGGESVGAGQPSNSPTITPPTIPTNTCTSGANIWVYNQNGVVFDCPGVNSIITGISNGAKTAIGIRDIPGHSFTGSINSYVVSGYGSAIASFPLIQAEIQYAEQKRAWFRQVYGNTSVLIAGSNGPGAGGQLIAVFDPTTRQYSWMNGYSPADIVRLNPNTNSSNQLIVLYKQLASNPPSTVNPSSQAAVVMGLTEDFPTTNTTKVTALGTYTFNGTSWIRSGGGGTICTPTGGTGSGTGGTGSTGTGGTAGTNISGFPRTVTVLVNLVNVRSGADTAASVIGTMTKNQTFVATGVVNGETVHGESRWWVRQNGGYIWAGNTNPGTSIGGAGGTGNTGATGGTGGGQPSNSPTITGPTLPTGTCTDPNTCAGVSAAISLVRRIPGYGAAGFTGDLTSYITSGFGQTVASHPLVQAEIQYAQQKMVWFPQVYGNASVLPEGSSAPLGSGARPPIAIYNTTTGTFSWMPNFSPTELSNRGALSSQWSLYSLFNQVKTAPPSQVNPSSQVSVMMGLGEDIPSANTSRPSSIGGAYRFNGSFWIKQ